MELGGYYQLQRDPDARRGSWRNQAQRLAEKYTSEASRSIYEELQMSSSVSNIIKFANLKIPSELQKIQDRLGMAISHLYRIGCCSELL